MNELASRAQVLVIVDGDCTFCRRAVAWIRPRLTQKTRFVPYQLVDLTALSLTRRECEQRVQFICGGYRSSGANAVADLLQDMKLPYKLLAHLMRSLAPVSQRVYDYVAAHRAGQLAQLIARQFPEIPDPLDSVDQ